MYIFMYVYIHIHVCILNFTNVETKIKKGNLNFRLYKISIIPMNYETKTVDLFLMYGGKVCCTDKAWYQFFINSVMIIEDMSTSIQPDTVLIIWSRSVRLECKLYNNKVRLCSALNIIHYFLSLVSILI